MTSDNSSNRNTTTTIRRYEVWSTQHNQKNFWSLSRLIVCPFLASLIISSSTSDSSAISRDRIHYFQNSPSFILCLSGSPALTTATSVEAGGLLSPTQKTNRVGKNCHVSCHNMSLPPSVCCHQMIGCQLIFTPTGGISIINAMLTPVNLKPNHTRQPLSGSGGCILSACVSINILLMQWHEPSQPVPLLMAS